MKLSEMSNTSLRVTTAIIMAGVMLLTVLLEIYGIPFLYIKPFHAVRWLGVFVVCGGIIEMLKCLKNTSTEIIQKSVLPIILFCGLLILMLVSVYFVGVRTWLMLWLLLIIVGADIGGWMFGKIFGGDKLWEKISANKTWAGQIGGVVCGTILSMLYCKILNTDVSVAIWVGISVSLLSQYGDLTASFIKRRLEIKDFSDILPGHGGILDRFDGWVYVLPLIWFIIK